VLEGGGSPTLATTQRIVIEFLVDVWTSPEADGILPVTTNRVPQRHPLL
jgi:hypothetical protein